MSATEVGARRPQVAGPTLVRGEGTFVSDVTLPGQLYVAIHRSTVPHARIAGIDTATAEAAPGELYPEGDGTFEFARTASRLMEMQSEDYIALPHEHSI